MRSASRGGKPRNNAKRGRMDVGLGQSIEPTPVTVSQREQAAPAVAQVEEFGPRPYPVVAVFAEAGLDLAAGIGGRRSPCGWPIGRRAAT